MGEKLGFCKKKKRKKEKEKRISGMKTICVWICMDCYGFVWILVCSIARV